MSDWKARLTRAGGSLKQVARDLDGDTGDGCYEPFSIRIQGKASRKLRRSIESLVRNSKPLGFTRGVLYGAGVDVDEMTPEGQAIFDPHLSRPW